MPRLLTSQEFLFAFDLWGSVAWKQFRSLEPHEFYSSQAEQAGFRASYAALRSAWITATASDDPYKLYPPDYWCREAQQKLKLIFQSNYFGLSIAKSNLLYRLLYLGEQLRTLKCTHHKGKWSGWNSSFDAPPCECQYHESGSWGNDLTGWLPANIKELRATGKIK